MGNVDRHACRKRGAGPRFAARIAPLLISVPPTFAFLLLNGCAALFNQTVTPPSFSPAPSTYDTVRYVSMTATPGDAIIRYTTDGSDPTPSTGKVYSGPITLSASTNFKAIAYKPGWLDSSVVSGDYTVKVKTRTFSVFNLSTNAYDEVPAVLEYTGAHCLVYVSKATADRVPTDTAHEIGTKFDDTIYGRIQSAFGSPSDVDGNHRVILLYLNINDGPAALGGYVAGFFNPADLYTGRTSNKGEILYIEDTRAAPTAPQTYATTAHELQHMINYNVRKIVPLIPMPSEDTWISEGLSTAAEGLYYAHERPHGVGFDRGRVAYYNNLRANTSIASGENFLSWGRGNDTVAHYVTDYLFFEWMRQQVARSTAGSANPTDGSELFKQILSDRAGDYRAVRDAFAAALSGTPGGPSTWKEILGDWFVANYLNRPNSLFGYFADTGELTLSPPVFSGPAGSSHSLYPGEGIYVAPAAKEWDAVSSGDTAYIGVNGSGEVTTASPYTGSDFVIAYNVNGRPNAGRSSTEVIPASVQPEPSAAARNASPPESLPIDVIFGADGRPIG